jgi:hypothetical protein
MATCPDCRRAVVRVTHGATTLVLDPQYQAYAAVEEHRLFPEDGDRVFLTLGLVEHHAVCPAQWRKRLAPPPRRKETIHD